MQTHLLVHSVQSLLVSLFQYPKPLGITFSNIRGLRSNFTSVQSFVLNNSPDLLALSESRLNCDISSDSFKLPGYIFHRLDHPPSHGLGVYVEEIFLLAVKALWNVTIMNTCAFASRFSIPRPTCFLCIVHLHHHPVQC